MFRALVLAALFARAAAAVEPEVEVHAGALRGLASRDPWASVVGARVGAGLMDWFAVAMRGAVAFRDPVFLGQDASGLHAWNTLMELRVRTPGPLRVHLAAAAGIGQMTTWQCDCQQSTELHGAVAFAWQLSSGIRFVGTDGASAGVEVTLTSWRGLQHAAFENQYQARPAPMKAVAVLLSAGWR